VVLRLKPQWCIRTASRDLLLSEDDLPDRSFLERSQIRSGPKLKAFDRFLECDA
jgi:hypothetical protein